MKVYDHTIDNLFQIDPRRDLLPFHYEYENFTFVNSITDADIIPVAYRSSSQADYTNLFRQLKITYKQLIVFLDIYHIGDGGLSTDHKKETIDFYKSKGLNSVVVHCDHSFNTVNLIHYDFLWNRHKAYYIDYNKFDLTDRHWSYKATKKMFELSEIKPKTLLKKFLIPNQTHKPNYLLSDESGESHTLRSKARVILEKAVMEHDCYYSNPNNYIFLEPQEISPEIMNDRHFFNMWMGFNPIANHYYDTSAISVYVETLASSISKQQSVTEKTYNPLIKGHFIIPFSYPGIIKDLKELYGFKFPNWIDYAYDSIEDDQERFHEFMKTFSRIRFLSLTELEERCNSSLDIFNHNRQVFRDRPYCSLHDSLVKSINQLIGR